MNRFGNLFKLTKPKFWQQIGLINLLLLPFSLLYAVGFYLKKIWVKPYNSKLKVITIGNLTLGGNGKTPTAIKIYQLLKTQGFRPCFLTRGYKGKITGPYLVNKADHAEQVGDEALLLAEIGPVVISVNRAEGAKLIENLAAYDVIIMDDGLQNFSLKQDFRLLVIDSDYKLGNGWLLPAGPLRELPILVENIDACLVIGEQDYVLPQFVNFKAKFILLTKLNSQAYTAFAGIGNPNKFFNLLKKNKVKLNECLIYPDHHYYNEEEQQQLAQKANLITTKKDWIKLKDPLKTKVKYIEIDLEITQSEKFLNLLIEKIKK